MGSAPASMNPMQSKSQCASNQETGNGKRSYLVQVGKAGKVRRSKKPPRTQGKRMRCDETAQDLCGDGDRSMERGSWHDGRWWEKGQGAREQGIIAMEKCFCMRGLRFVFGGEDGEDEVEQLLPLPPHRHTNSAFACL
jgi:hypothetical protein